MDLNDPEIENMIPADLRGAIDRLNTVEGKDTMPELNGLDEKWLLSKNRQVGAKQIMKMWSTFQLLHF